METAISIIMAVVAIIVGGLCAYYRTNAKLKERAVELINIAEGMYTDATKQGGRRFTWVCDQLYSIIPLWLKTFLTREAVGRIVQTAFDWMQGFAKQQLDKLTDKITE